MGVQNEVISRVDEGHRGQVTNSRIWRTRDYILFGLESFP